MAPSSSEALNLTIFPFCCIEKVGIGATVTLVVRRQSGECADCGTAAAAVELQGFELKEEQQVYSAVGAAAKSKKKEKVKGRASKRASEIKAWLPKQLIATRSLARPLHALSIPGTHQLNLEEGTFEILLLLLLLLLPGKCRTRVIFRSLPQVRFTRHRFV